jgi:hypothetical protein
MDFKNLKEKIWEPKVLRLLPNVCDFQKDRYGFKNLKKVCSLSYGFLFFVISIFDVDFLVEMAKMKKLRLQS